MAMDVTSSSFCLCLLFLFLIPVCKGARRGESACTRLDETNITRVSCDWGYQYDTCGRTPRGMFSYPDWICFASCFDGPWAMTYLLHNSTITLKSPWLCPTGIDVYTLSFQFLTANESLHRVTKPALFVLKETEENTERIWFKDSNWASEGFETVGNVSVFCKECNFRIVFETSNPDFISGLNYIVVNYTGALPPSVPNMAKLNAMWLAGLVIIVLVAVASIPLGVLCWRRLKNGIRNDNENYVKTTDNDQPDTDSGLDSGESAVNSTEGASANEVHDVQNTGDNQASLVYSTHLPPLERLQTFECDSEGYLSVIADPFTQQAPEPSANDNFYDEPDNVPLPFNSPH